MNNRDRARWLVFAVMITLLAVPALAQNPEIDYLGYGWEDGGFPPSNPGDVLVFTAVSDFADPIFGVDLGTRELTFYMYDLVSTGQIDVGGGNLLVNYTGGMLEIYEDTAMNADWGINPPNGTSPDSFTDGSLFFKGSFNSFALFLTPAGDGTYEGNLDGIGGSIIDGICSGCAFTWGGNFTIASSAQIPEGYDIQVDGEFNIEAAVATEQSTWGAVKALYGN